MENAPCIAFIVYLPTGKKSVSSVGKGSFSMDYVHTDVGI